MYNYKTNHNGQVLKFLDLNTCSSPNWQGILYENCNATVHLEHMEEIQKRKKFLVIASHSAICFKSLWNLHTFLNWLLLTSHNSQYQFFRSESHISGLVNHHPQKCKICWLKVSRVKTHLAIFPRLSVANIK